LAECLPVIAPRAVLFDFDGVIADTENYHVAAWQRTLARLGWEVADERAARAAEIDDRQFLAELFARRKIAEGDVEGWVRRKQELTVALLAESPRLYPGVAELVGRLRGQVRLAVVSTTWRENIETVLRAASLADAFDVLIGKEDVRAVKPDPEGYLQALERLGVRGAEAVALEDSATGLAAARTAGLRSVAVGHRLSRGDWVGTSPYLPALANTADVLTALGLTDPAA
jgi:HAD superfamily hydrolase (TIGR01509 family)